MNNDPLANVLSKILTYERLAKRECTVKFNSKLIRNVLDLLNRFGYIGSYQIIDDGKSGLLKINLLGKINKCGVIKPRFNIKKTQLDKFEKSYLPAKDFGIIIISTSKGLMIHKEAKEHGMGGRLIAYCY